MEIDQALFKWQQGTTQKEVQGKDQKLKNTFL